MSDETQAAAELWSNVQVVVDQGRRNCLSSRQIAEQLLATFQMEIRSEPPTCKFCGADCSDGRNWNGGDDYECVRCAEGKLELRLILERAAPGTRENIAQLLEEGWRRSRGTENELYGDLDHDDFCWADTDDWKLRAVAAQLWARGWRK